MSVFSDAKTKFSSIELGDNIDTDTFLSACSEIVPFFDKLGPVAFSPVKKDINGNIQRLRERYETDANKYSTIQSIVDAEIEDGSHTGKYSCTEGLLWLKRALEFIYVFLDTISKGEHDLRVCATTAYDCSLRQYHGWIVRGIYAVAVRAVPSYEDFIKSLKSSEETTDKQVLQGMVETLMCLKTNIDSINHFYKSKGLEFKDTV